MAGFTLGGGSGFSEFSSPSGIALDRTGTMYILDTGNYRVVKWTPGQPVGYAVAGGRGAGSTIDKLSTSYAFCLDSLKNIYVSESSNHRISKWLNGNNATGILVSIFGDKCLKMKDTINKIHISHRWQVQEWQEVLTIS